MIETNAAHGDCQTTQSADSEASIFPTTTMMSTFSTLGLSEHRIQALAQLGINTPADIQAQAYPILSKQQDVWLSAPTGSGKTLAYLLPLLERIDTSKNNLQVAVLAPTQELSVQIQDCIRLLEQSGSPAIRSQLLIGNASSKRQKEKLKQKPHIVVGTCGRMLSLANERKLKLHLCHCVVIDEADNMLAEDSIEDVEALIKMTPRDRHIVFTSATEKGHTFELAQSIGNQVRWLQGEARKNVSTIQHSYIEARYHNKTKALQQLLETLQPERAIVFLHRNASAEEIGEELAYRQLHLLVLHGGLNKFEREKALNQFRRGKVKVLIASDVAARGLDIKGVSHIINFDLPSSSDDYLHRSGRTGRMGAIGNAISIVTAEERKLIKRYERDLGITIQALNGRSACAGLE
jgi:ATP-dependent RNA helicase DeaD